MSLLKKDELDSYKVKRTWKLDYREDSSSSFANSKNNNLEEAKEKETSPKTWLLRKIERCQQKIALEKLKDIVINESRKGYYRNAVNVTEQIELEKNISMNELGQEYLETTIMQVYANGYCEFFTIRRAVNKVKELKK